MSALAGLVGEGAEHVAWLNQTGDEIALRFERLAQLELKMRECGLSKFEPEFKPIIAAGLRAWQRDPHDPAEWIPEFLRDEH